MRDKISFILIHSGAGRRLRAAGNRALFHVAPECTLLQYQTDVIYSSYPNAEIITTLGFDKDKILKQLPHGVKTVEDLCYADYGPARAIGLALRVASYERVVVIHGDMYFNHNHLYPLTRDKSFILVDNQGAIASNKVGAVIQNKVQHLAYGIENKFAQVFYMAKHETSLMRRVTSENRSQRLLTHEALNRIINAGAKFEARYNEDFIVEINEQNDILKIKDKI